MVEVVSLPNHVTFAFFPGVDALSAASRFPVGAKIILPSEKLVFFKNTTFHHSQLKTPRLWQAE